MTIQSLEFFAFFALVLVLYYIIPKKFQNLLLLVASYVFYISISLNFALILLVMTLVNFGWAHYISRVQGKSRRKRLIIGIFFNTIIWLFFKLANFFVLQVIALIKQLGLPFNTGSMKVLLPIGLSFYTLQAISYLLDVHREQMPPSQKLVDFSLYMAYFPKLTAGPIERAQRFLPQLRQSRSLDNKSAARSFTLIIIGLFRKIVVADTLMAVIPRNFIQEGASFSLLEILIWVMTGAFALYNDFCGYTNMVRGISGFFGIELTRNFAHPLFARNFSEFWGRWHISLSSWLRDYIYFPLSRYLVRRNPNVKNKANIILPPMVTMIVSALWHNPQLSYLTWGVFMGVALAGERVKSAFRPVKPPSKLPLWRQSIAMTLTTVLGLGIPILLVTHFYSLGTLFQHILNHSPWTLPQSRVFLLILPGLWIDILQYRSKNETPFMHWAPITKALLLALAALGIFFFAQERIAEPFIYQGF